MLFALIESHTISFKRLIIMIGVGGFFFAFFSLFRLGFVLFGLVRFILVFVFMENQVFRASFIGTFTDALNLFWGGKCWFWRHNHFHLFRFVYCVYYAECVCLYSYSKFIHVLIMAILKETLWIWCCTRQFSFFVFPFHIFCTLFCHMVHWIHSGFTLL